MLRNRQYWETENIEKQAMLRNKQYWATDNVEK